MKQRQTQIHFRTLLATSMLLAALRHNLIVTAAVLLLVGDFVEVSSRSLQASRWVGIPSDGFVFVFLYWLFGRVRWIVLY